MIKVTSVLAANLERDLAAIAAERGKIIGITPATFTMGTGHVAVASYLVVSGHRVPKPDEGDGQAAGNSYN